MRQKREFEFGKKFVREIDNVEIINPWKWLNQFDKDGDRKEANKL